MESIHVKRLPPWKPLSGVFHLLRARAEFQPWQYDLPWNRPLSCIQCLPLHSPGDLFPNGVRDRNRSAGNPAHSGQSTPLCWLHFQTCPARRHLPTRYGTTLSGDQGFHPGISCQSSIWLLFRDCQYVSLP